MKKLLAGKFDCWIAIGLLISGCGSCFLHSPYYPEWKYRFINLVPVVLFPFSIGFAISAIRQPEWQSKLIGLAIVVLFVLALIGRPSFSDGSEFPWIP